MSGAISITTFCLKYNLNLEAAAVLDEMLDHAWAEGRIAGENAVKEAVKSNIKLLQDTAKTIYDNLEDSKLA